MISKRFQIDEENAHKRIDIFLSHEFDSISRGIVQELIEKGEVLVNDKVTKRNYKLKTGDLVDITINLEIESNDVAEDIELDIVFENKDFLIINKQANLTVHPGAGQKDGTLINGLLYKYPKQRDIPRYGVVHRLDKDTSGLMVVARSLKAHTLLTEMIQERVIKRNYYALVHGSPIAGMTIDKPIGRHPKNRLLFCVKEGGREAITHFKVKTKFSNFSLLDVSLETGRTHQIRVHLKHLGHPIAGDAQYSNIKQWKNSSPDEVEAVGSLGRQALHAYSLAFDFEGKAYEFIADIPEAILNTIKALS